MTDDEKTMHGVHMMIRSEIGSVLCCGLEPKRIYMNGRTRDLFVSQCSMILHEIVIAEKDKKERIYGVPIGICNDLEDGEIDVSVKR